MIFISYNSQDWPSVEIVVNELTARELELALDRQYLIPGSEIADLGSTMEKCTSIIAFYGPYGLGPWQKGEIDLGWKMHVNNPAFRFVPVILPEGEEPSGLPSAVVYSDLRTNLNDREKLDILASSVRTIGSDGAPELPAASAHRANPYRSLRPFREEDAPFFFGRDLQITKLLALIKIHRFLAVVAASGSGKSSLVMAGLVPALRRQEGWGIVRMVPTSDPWRSLAAELVPIWQPDLRGSEMLVETRKLANLLSTQELTVKDILLEIVKHTRFGHRFLLIVDQWEELYALCEDDKIRTAFIDGLLDAAEHESLSMLLTLRGDFYAHALRHRRLADELDQKNVNLGPLNRDEMRAIIEKPAKAVGMHFQDGLVESILDDVGGQDSALPLLEYLLTQMWELKKGDELTFQAYNRLGKLEGAIAQSAEEAWKKIPDAQEPFAEALLLRLVQLNLVGFPTRRRARADELSPEQMKIARMLADHRILVTSRDPATGAEIVEVAHETLLFKWERFTGLLRKQREFLLWHRRLDFTSTDYYNQGEDPDALLKGHALAEARNWFQVRREGLSEQESRFIQRSIERDDAVREVRRLEEQFIAHQSDSNLLKSYLARSETLWPSNPRIVGELEGLRADAERLFETVPAKLSLVSKLEHRMGGEDSTRIRWQFQTLSQLTTDIQELCSSSGLIPELGKRIEFAKTVEAISVTDRKDYWEQIISQIHSAPIYGGLSISPQLGLIPLGFSPDSGLAEFLHVESHQGEIPLRGEGGFLPMLSTTGLILVLLPSGKFHMGAQDIDPKDWNYDPKAESIEGPVHEVELSAFFMSKHLMTQGQWQRLTGKNPSRYPAGARDNGYSYTPLHPVETITWAATSAVLFKTGLEIPTEAQWEYAARAGTSTVYWTGNDENSIARGAHLLFNRLDLKRHAPVGSYDGNPFGLYDVIGNLWEFTRDRSCTFDQPCRDGDGLRGMEGKSLIVRGCSFFNSSTQARVAYRTEDNTPEKFESWMGVRPARQLSPPADA
jgi:formylglycine-generating enzyme required for sulfatase activity